MDKLIWIRIPHYKHVHYRSVGKEFIYDVECSGTIAQLRIIDEFRNTVIEHCFKKKGSALRVSELIENG
jgi:hypothetical protein